MHDDATSCKSLPPLATEDPSWNETAFVVVAALDRPAAAGVPKNGAKLDGAKGASRTTWW